MLAELPWDMAVPRPFGFRSVLTDNLKGCWVEEVVPLSFQWGGFRVFWIGLRALVLKVHFTKLMEFNTGAEDFPRPLPDRVEAVLVRSQPAQETLRPFVLLPHFIRYVPAHYKRYCIDLTGSFPEYLKKFSSKSRWTLSKKVRKFQESAQDKVYFREFRNPKEMIEFHRLARVVSGKTYQEKLLNVALPENEEFKEEMTELAARDSVRGYILFHSDTPIAYLYCPIEDDIVFYNYLGHDPEFRVWSPGTVLQYFALESLFAEKRFRLFDFTEGEGQHKEVFSTSSTRCADVYYFRRSLRNIFLVLGHWEMGVASGFTAKILKRLGMKARIKKFLRFGYES
jgi:GNAT acetyltransferase-like protein